MMSWVKNILFVGLMSFVFLYAPFANAASPLPDGFLLRGYGKNQTPEPGKIKCNLYDDDGNIIGTIATFPPENGLVEHEILLNDGSRLSNRADEDAVVMGTSPVNASAFPELAKFEGDDRYQIWTFSTNVYRGSNMGLVEATGAFRGVKSGEVRCVFLVEITPQGPVVLSCLKCHYFFGF